MRCVLVFLLVVIAHTAHTEQTAETDGPTLDSERSCGPNCGPRCCAFWKRYWKRKKVEHLRRREREEEEQQKAERLRFLGAMRQQFSIPASVPRSVPAQCQHELTSPSHVLLGSGDFDFSSLPASASRPWADLDNPVVVREGAMITIVTPTHTTNVTILERVAQSVFAQSMQLFVWVLIDNNTTKEGRRLLNELVDRDPRVLLCECNQRLGLSKARNCAFEQRLVNTPYVVFLDDDDMLERTHLEKLVWLLETFDKAAFANTFEVAFGAKEFLWTRTLFFDSRYRNEQVISGVSQPHVVEVLSYHTTSHCRIRGVLAYSCRTLP